MRKRTVITEDFGNHDYELEHCPTGDILKAQVGDKVVIAYLVQDDDYSPDDMGDCMGKLLSFHRWSKDIEEGANALGNTLEGEPDLDAVWYAHRREAQRRAHARILKDFTLDELLETFKEQGHIHRRGVSNKNFVSECQKQDLDEYDDWRNLGCDDEAAVETALTEMWSEPAYFPGDPDAQVLDCYDHGGQHWSLSGGGMQCRWDTASGAGVWIPDECLRKELDSAQRQAVYALVENTTWVRRTGKSYQLLRVEWKDETHCEKVHVRFSDDASELYKEAKELAQGRPEPTPKQLRWAREQQAAVYAQQFLDEYNAIISGDVYGCVVETFELGGDQIEEEACWGFVQGDYAEEALKDEFFDPTCKRLAKEYEEDVRTQGGAQMEIV